MDPTLIAVAQLAITVAEPDANRRAAADAVAEAGALRGRAAEVRDRGATADPDGPAGAGAAYWPEVADLLVASYRSLHRALNRSADAAAA